MTRFNSLTSGCALLVLCLATAIASPAATTFKTLLNFNGTNGSAPEYVALVQGTDGNLYGTTSFGGKNDAGTVFKITTAGKLTTLYSFCSKANCADGEYPEAGLLLATNGNFYGTSERGGGKCSLYGTLGCGTVFEITPEGKLTTLYAFCLNNGKYCSDGAFPKAPLIQGTNGDFFGTTYFGGNSNDAGTLFEITPAGKLTTHYTFCSKAGQGCPDGANPNGVIQGTDGNLYGSTFDGGGVPSSGDIPDSDECEGTLFKVGTLRGTITTLEYFCKIMGPPDLPLGLTQVKPGTPNSSELLQVAVGSPAASQTLTFYGPSSGGGTHASGTIFTFTSTKKLTVLYNFCAKKDCADGAYPSGVIEGTDGNFYGTTTGGNGKCAELNGCGTVFEVTTKGVLTTLHSFDGTDGEHTYAGLVQATNGTFYGATTNGGKNGDGTIFSLSTGLGPFVKTVPTAGDVGTTVMILGTDLTGASEVTFNGTAADFKVVSATEITATVPSGATTGTVEVTTPSGTLKSFSFQVL